MIHHVKRKISAWQEERVVRYLTMRAVRVMNTRRKLVHFIEFCQKDELCQMDPPPDGWQKWGDSALRVVAATYMREGYDRARLKTILAPKKLLHIFEGS